MNEPSTMTLAQAAADAPENADTTLPENRTRLERRADFVRHKLMRTLTAIETKRRDAARVEREVRRKGPMILAAASAAALAFGGLTLALAVRTARGRSRARAFWPTLIAGALGIIVTELELQRAYAALGKD